MAKQCCSMQAPVSAGMHKNACVARSIRMRHSSAFAQSSSDGPCIGRRYQAYQMPLFGLCCRCFIRVYICCKCLWLCVCVCFVLCVRAYYGSDRNRSIASRSNSNENEYRNHVDVCVRALETTMDMRGCICVLHVRVSHNKTSKIDTLCARMDRTIFNFVWFIDG